jgi:hypothetical protein
MANTGFHSVVANRAQMCTADCHEENNLTTEKIILLWQSAVHLKAVCQGVILVVANRGIGVRFAIKEYHPYYMDSPSVRGSVYFCCGIS